MDKLIRDMRDAAKMTLALPDEAVVGVAAQLAVMAQKAADELEKRRWVSVEERLPEQGENVLALWECGPEIVVDFAIFMAGQIGEIWRYKNWVAPPDAVTNWMPLPSVEE